MKQLVKSIVKSMGYEIHRLNTDQHRFVIGGITYEVDPCSVGQTPQGEMTGEAAIRMIKERGLHDLRILDICCGVGIIGMTIFSRLNNDSTVTGAGFIDINIFNLNSLQRTLKINQMEGLVGNKIKYWLSDSLKNIPIDEKFDLIVSNPPHFFVPDRTSTKLTAGQLGTYDADWSFHKSFYESCHNYLTHRGEIWFLENGDAVDSNGLLPFINANPNLQYVSEMVEPLDPTYFWMFSRAAFDR